jgi:choline dehydrogenase-like flavoprotein
MLVERRDKFGVPTAGLDWRLTEQDMASMRRTQQLFGRAWLSDGHRLVESYLEDRGLPPYLWGGNHHMGTTRMADSPRQGVVDRDCRVHGVDNLFIAGSSVFPTGGYANPTLTLLALAIRLADFIVLRSRSRVDVDSSSD